MPAERLVGFAFVWIALVAVMWDQFSLARRAGASDARSRSRQSNAATGRTPWDTVDDASSQIVPGRMWTGRMFTGRFVAAVAGTSITLGGCFTTSTDYQQDRRTSS